MCKKIVKILAVTIILAGYGGKAFSAESATRVISATIPASSGLDVTVSKIDPKGTGNPSDDTWLPGNQTSINFGELTFNNTHHIFMASHYFAVDVGVNSNTGSWILSHTTTSIQGTGANLDNNVNVTFVKQLDSLTEDWKNKYSFAASNGKAYSKSDLAGGWLRIYYGIATGDPVYPDNPEVKVVTTDKPAGSYSGAIILTLTQ